MIFTTLFTNLIPLYVIIGIGFAAGRLFDLDRKSLADLSIFVLMPVTLFGFIGQIEVKWEYVLLPFVTYAMHLVLAITALFVGRKIWEDETPNLLSICAGMVNTGYFGLPVVALLFDTQWAGVYTFLLLGAVFFEASYGYFFAARGHFTAKESLKKLAKLPALYAIAAAIIFNLSGLSFNAQTITYWEHFKGAYIIIGMMIIGVALSRVKKLEFGGGRFFAIVQVWQWILWPLVALAIVSFDKSFTGWFDDQVHKLIIVYSILPPAANIAAFAAQLNLTPEKAATTVLVGTVIGLFYIPAALWFLGFAPL